MVRITDMYSLPRGVQRNVMSFYGTRTGHRIEYLRNALRRRPKAMAQVGNVRLLARNYFPGGPMPAMQLMRDVRQYKAAFTLREPRILYRYLSLVLRKPEYQVVNAVNHGDYTYNPYNRVPMGYRRLRYRQHMASGRQYGRQARARRLMRRRPRR